MGADVVKIESPSGDPGRGLRGAEGEKDREYFIVRPPPSPPPTPALRGRSELCCWQVWNSNKRSVSLNLRSEEGKALLFRMLPEYDVFVENYVRPTPGTPAQAPLPAAEGLSVVTRRARSGWRSWGLGTRR